jgi:hypothetical protein
MSVGSRADLSLRGLPEWLIRKYLGELGAAPAGPPDAPRMTTATCTVGWTASRVTLPGGTITLTQFDIMIEGPSDDVAALEDAFMKKALRGGG